MLVRHAPAGINFTTSIVQSIGDPLTNFTYDESTNVMTITPAAIPAGTVAGIAQGAYMLTIDTSTGSNATLGYVEVVN